MKAILALLMALTSTSAFAQNVLCYKNANSDYALRLVLNDADLLTKVSLSNQDWGGAGYSDLQDVTQIKNVYVVAGRTGSVGLKIGSTLDLMYVGKRLSAVMVIGESSQAEMYTCN